MAGRWDYCLTCKEGIWLTPAREEMLRRSGQSFYCLWGHSQHFTQGPSETALLRQERDRLKQNAAYLEDRANRLRDERDAATRRASAARGQVTKIKKRVGNGVCPCCNRTFADLQRHMASKHAGFVAEEVQAEAGQTIQ
jgi:hypothetical protein